MLQLLGMYHRQLAQLSRVARGAHLELRRPCPLLLQAGSRRHHGASAEAGIAGVHRRHQRSTALAVELTDQRPRTVVEELQIGGDDSRLRVAPRPLALVAPGPGDAVPGRSDKGQRVVSPSYSSGIGVRCVLG